VSSGQFPLSDSLSTGVSVLTPAKHSAAPASADAFFHSLGQIYAFDDCRRNGRSADESGHLFVRLSGSVRGARKREAGQFMSDN
jgi:hypothetical protein